MHETLDHDLTAAEALFSTPEDDLTAAAELFQDSPELEALSRSLPEPTAEEKARIMALIPRPRTTAKETAYTGPSERITIRIQTNTLKRIKAAAEAKRMPYQTLINQMLCTAL